MGNKFTCAAGHEHGSYEECASCDRRTGSSNTSWTDGQRTIKSSYNSWHETTDLDFKTTKTDDELSKRYLPAGPKKALGNSQFRGPPPYQCSTGHVHQTKESVTECEERRRRGLISYSQIDENGTRLAVNADLMHGTCNMDYRSSDPKDPNNLAFLPPPPFQGKKSPFSGVDPFQEGLPNLNQNAVGRRPFVTHPDGKNSMGTHYPENAPHSGSSTTDVPTNNKWNM